MPQKTVFRVVRRRAKSGCAPAYEALVRAMFEQARGFSGYLSAELIPPEAEGGEYQILQRFATEADLARWQASDERAGWMEKLSHVAEGDPEYRLLHGLEAWFSPAPQPAPRAALAACPRATQSHPPKRRSNSKRPPPRRAGAGV